MKQTSNRKDASANSRWALANPSALGESMMQLVSELYPINRSITGDGLRKSLDVVARHVPLQVIEVPSGAQVLDWVVPDEWNLREAYIKTPDGRVIADFADSNLHVVSYSTPVHTEMSLEELRVHLHSLPDHPDWIPYRTSYYTRDWGFCLPHRELEALAPGTYEIFIDSDLSPGALSYGEAYLPGEIADEVLISAHICHPSMCNDNLSGVAVATFLADWLASRQHRYSYRFVFAPATIGAITWLARNLEVTAEIKHGLVLSCLGDAAPPTYKLSRRGDAEIDRAAELVMGAPEVQGRVIPFSPYGYDERQYGSPGFNLAVGALMRSPNGAFPEYHTSADNLSFISGESLADSLTVCLRILECVERNRILINLSPKGEPQLGRRGLYRSTGGPDVETFSFALLWVLNQSDGNHSLLDIACQAKLPFELIADAADRLEEVGLVEQASGQNLP